jgi:hypothetical protein
MVTAPSAPTYDNCIDTANDILPFELSMFYMDIQTRMTALFQKTDNNGKLWFSSSKIKRPVWSPLQPLAK